MKNKNLKLSRARLLAVQTLSAYHFGNNSDLKQLITDMKKYYIKEEYSEGEKENYKDFVDLNFFENLLLGIQDKIDFCDAVIQENLKDGYTLEGMQDVLKESLRLAVFELKFMEKTPTKVIINEYVDIVAEFFDDKKITFANAIIDNMSKKLRKSE